MEIKIIPEMWDNNEKAGYGRLALVAKAAQTLPTSFTNIEQTFSESKLLKTYLRNQMSEKSLEALLLISQELR